MDPVEIREIPVTEAGLVDALVTRSFSYPSGGRYFQDFPIWNSDRVIRLGAFSGAKLLSHVGIRFAGLKVPGATVPAAFIGGVATDSTHRGQGHSTRLLKEALTRIDATPAEWTILWGSEHEFYARLGFSPSGTQARALIADLSVSPRDLNLQAPKSGLTEAIFADLIERRDGVAFDAGDRSWVFAHQTVEWLCLEKPFAYVAFQRGLDLHNVVHETGGDLDGIKKLLFHVFQRNPNAEILSRPSTLIALGFESSSWFEEPLCLARPKRAGMKWNPAFWISGIGAV